MTDLYWTAMDDCMSPVNTPVLVLGHDGTISLAKLDYAPAGVRQKGKEWVWWDGVGFGGYEWEWDWEAPGRWRGVTHWCLLPEIKPQQEKPK